MPKRLLNLLFLLVLLFPSVASDSAAQGMSATSSQRFRSSSVMFIENVGQFAEGARFQVWGGPAGTMWLSDDAIWLTVVEPRPEEAALSSADPEMRFDLPLADAEGEGAPRNAINIKLSFVGANPHPRIEPFDRLDTVVSYFIGNEPDKWRPDVPVWGGVRYVDLYPNVDLEVTSESGQMVQRLAARPGADLTAVQLRVEGADAVMVDGGALRLSTAAGVFATPPLLAGGMGGNIVVRSRGDQVFNVDTPFAPTGVRPQSAITIPQSPTDNPAHLIYGTYLGGTGADYSEGIAVDAQGSAYVVGWTYSSDFPTTLGAVDPSFNGGQIDAFVVKLNPTGTGLVYATFLGSSRFDYGLDIAVDTSGNAYATGVTYAGDFPTTSGAFDPNFNGGYTDAFVVKLNLTGSALAYATFLGGSGVYGDSGNSIAVDTIGNAYVTGRTYSSTFGDFPTTSSAFDTTFNGDYKDDAFVVKLNSTGSRLTYSTYLGGEYDDSGIAIAVDAAGNAYVTGFTESQDFPTTPGAFDTQYNDSYNADAFVVKLNSTGSGLTYSTYLGGEDEDKGESIAVDTAGNAYVTGFTKSPNFPTTPGAFDTEYSAAYREAVVAKLNPGGNSLSYATFLGGSVDSFGGDIVVDATGNAHITGFTSSPDFPTTPDAFDTSYNGPGRDVFVVKLYPEGSGVNYATFISGSGDDSGFGIARDAAGQAYVTGQALSANFPTTPGAFDASYNSGDAFVVKLSMGPPPPIDAANLASQSDYLTVAPGAAINPWVEVRNTGNTTWTPAEYGWNGKGALAGTMGYMPRNVAPGETQKFFWNLTAPTTPGTYDYGFMLRHGTQEFGPYFFVRMTVIGYTISGRVVDTNGAGIAGVTVRADSSHTTTTDSIGNYTLSGLVPGIYTVQPSKNGYAFCPIDRRVNVSSNVAGQDFTGFGATVALGFCPSINGYNFANGDPGWGFFPFSAYDFRDLDLIRMFGQDKVCVMAGADCVLKPQATVWLRWMNFLINFGHCDGMASTSLRFFKAKDLPQTFNPGASTAHGLTLDNVRRHIAYYMVEQYTEPVSIYKEQIRQNAPSAILNQLRTAMQGGADPTTLFLRMAGEGGHTVTPYAIEDRGSGVSWVRVYDNNHPDDFTRYVVIDTANESWSYRAGSTTWWTGDRSTRTLGIVPISKYAAQPVCPWCGGSSRAAALDSPSMQEVSLSGPGHLLITDAQGRRFGYSGTQFVNEIPGAYSGFVDGGLGVELESIYRLPVNSGYTVLLDGQTSTQPGNVTVSQFGPGYAAQVDNIRLQPTVRDSITIAADGSQITYQPNSERSPTLSLALDDATASYALEVVGAEISAGQRVSVAAQETTGRLVYSNAQASGGEYGLLIRRVSPNGAQSFVHNALTVDAGDTHYADYRSWDGQGSMTLLIDRGSDGTIDETRLLTNDIKRVFLPVIRR